jgi:hypothetical protein
LKKKRHPPHLAVLHENLKASWRSLLFEYFNRAYFWEKSLLFLEISTVVAQVDKICFWILWTWSNRQTCLGWYCNPQLLQPWFSTNFRGSPLLFYFNNTVTKTFWATCAKEKSVSNSLHIHLIEIIMQNFLGGNPFVDGILGHSLLLSRAFVVGIPSWVGF